ncbi:MAG: hypothetical protein KBC12_03555 [Candidatus Pacebacteria bacterium]|nr:hypothetical protein [Candidatus Paceibacterota bacterium]MBP9851265.1 hypothetical protein [Candidatus Paceibacterota bacterium]
MEKIKRFIKSDQGKDLWIVLIVFLVGSVSFGLGRLSASDTGGLDIKYTNLEASGLTGAQEARVFLQNNPKLDKSTQAVKKAFYASSRGKKYYSADCSAGNTIKPENRIYFETAERAESAGYSLSTACR